jgi:hypothetical protein
MRKSLKLIIGLLFAAVFQNSSATQPPNTIPFNGKNYYINGINVPWNAFGTDAGTHYEWGALYDPSFFTTFFQACQSYGVNCVRLWIHCDGRSTPEFDDNGAVTGLDTNFLSDFDGILRIARENNVMVMPCLWSFDMTKDFTSTAGKYAGMHADLIKDTVKTRSYINNALIPMVKHLANTCNLFAWEVINEPEWSISGPGNTTQLVTAQEMVRFCAMIAEAIHLNSTKMVTVGSACLKWHSMRQPPAEAHYWSDSSFKAAYNKPQAFLDFYQIHYYDWMYNADWGYDPFQATKTPAYWKLDKPTIIGEWPGMAGQYTVKQMVDNAYANGYAGIMPWSYNAKDGYGTWDGVKNELKAFHDAHAAMVDFSCGANPVIEHSRKSICVKISAGSSSRVVLFDIRGRRIWSGISSNAVRQPLNGNQVFLCQIRDQQNRIIGLRKAALVNSDEGR